MPLLSTHMTTAVRLAKREAEARGQSPTSEHLLFALLWDRSGILPVLDDLGLSEKLEARLARQIDHGDLRHPGDARDLLDRAAKRAAGRGDAHIGFEHVLVEMVMSDTGVAELLEELSVRDAVLGRWNDIYGRDGHAT